MRKVILAVFSAVLFAVIAAKLAFDLSDPSRAHPGNQPWAQNTMQSVAWNGGKWTVWIRDGVFEQRPQDERRWSGHANSSLAFIDWDGEPWQAKIEGDAFLLAHRGDWKRSVGPAQAIRYRDWDGEYRLRTIAQLQR